MKDYSLLSFYLDPKMHEDFKIRLYYDGFKNQSEFFRACVIAYLEKEKSFREFLDNYRLSQKMQGKAKISRSGKLAKEGEALLKSLALTEEEVENIFDILEKDLPELC